MIFLYIVLLKISINSLESVLSRKGKPSPVSLTLGCPTLKRNSVPHDVVFVTEEGKEIGCHKCVLVARSGQLVIKYNN